MRGCDSVRREESVTSGLGRALYSSVSKCIQGYQGVSKTVTAAKDPQSGLWTVDSGLGLGLESSSPCPSPCSSPSATWFPLITMKPMGVDGQDQAGE